MAAIPWRCCCAYRTACSSRWPTIPRRVCRRALAGAARGGGRRLPGDPFRTRRRALGWPHAGGAGLTSCPQRLWKSLGIAAVHVNSDVITRAWRRRSISVRSGARSLFTTPMRQSQPPRARGAFFSAMIPPRCSAFPCLFRHDCSRAFVARDGRAGRDDERGDGRRQARARGRDRRRSRRPDGGRGPGRPGYSVDVYDAMPSVGRKFLMAGRGGLNLTHSEPAGPFLARYGDRARRSRHGWHGWMPPPCATGRMAWACAPSSARRAACSPRK